MAYFINKFNCYQVMKQGDIRITCPPMGRLEPFSLQARFFLKKGLTTH